MTLAINPNWPPFEPHELPPGMPPDLVAHLPSLHAASLVIMAGVYEHELFRAFGRDQRFLDKVNGTGVAPAIGLLRTSLSSTLIIGLAGLFKSDQRSVNLRHLLKALCNERHAAFFAEEHRRHTPPIDSEHQRGRLVRMQRRINREPLRSCLKRIDDLRDQAVAHIELSPAPDFVWPLVTDVSKAYVAASNITFTALHYMTRRRVVVRRYREEAKTLTRDFLQSVQPGALADEEDKPTGQS